MKANYGGRNINKLKYEEYSTSVTTKLSAKTLALNPTGR